MSLAGLASDCRPNVLLVTIDCLRPDFLGCYDESETQVSPAIDELAETGHRFDNAFANASQTPVSFPSLFTANYPLSHGGPNYLADDRVFVAEWFRQNGYHTAGFSTNHWLSYTANYPTGYDEYREYYQFHEKVRNHATYLVEKGYADGKSLETLATELRPVLEEQYGAAIEGTETYLEQVDWESEQIADAHSTLQRERALLREDFEAFVEAVDADLERGNLGERIKKFASNYPPLRKAYYLATSATSRNETPRDKPMTDAETVTGDVVSYLDQTETDDEPLYCWTHYMDAHRPYLPGSSDNWENEYEGYLDAIGESVSFDDINQQRFNAYETLYMGCIRYIDEQLSRVLEAARELERDTIVLVTADHGEEFREHGSIDHNAKLYDELIHVPLIVSKLGGDAGATHSRLVSHVDLLPTVYNAVVPDASVPDAVEGQDVFSSQRSEIISETLRTASSPENPDQVGRHLDVDHERIAARSHEEKQIYYRDEDAWQYYDLNEDPNEQHNLAPAQESSALRERIVERRAAIQAMRPDGDDEQREQPSIVQNRLEDLGYTM